MPNNSEQKAMKIGIIGSAKSILGFRALGVETFRVRTEQDLERAKQEIAARNFAILFITQDIAERFEKHLDVFYKKALPAVLVVPGIRGGEEKGREGLNKIMERAIGTAKIQL